MNKLPDCFTDLRSYVHSQLKRTGQKVPLSTLVNIMFKYNELFEDGLQCMWNFVQWSKNHNQDEDIIFSTIMHDFNGMNDRCFLPRTDSYKESYYG